MMTVILGGSASGKSAYAEELAGANAQTGKKYYLATMRILDEEARKKVERHKKLRAGSGFCTIEQPTGIQGALRKMEAKERTVLLECIMNLTANEMFSDGGGTKEQVAERIVYGIRQLKEQTKNLIVVSGNVFEDGVAYDHATMEYVYAMGEINRRLAAMADHVVEVVVGLPVFLS